MNPVEKTEDENRLLTSQQEQVRDLYDGIAERYDSDFEAKAEYAAPGYLIKMFSDAGISGGSILDVGCGTGKLREYLGDKFQYAGIDLSPKMLSVAEGRGYSVEQGVALEILKKHSDRSVDHIVSLSSLYFMEDFHALVAEFERIARKSMFVTLEQFPPETIKMMHDRGIAIYNHPTSAIDNPTNTLSGVYLWKRPGTDQKIYGDVVFKKME